MALQGYYEKKDGVDVFNLKFTKGTVSQLKDLADFLKHKGFNIPENTDEKLASVVIHGISLLQTFKEDE